MPLSFHMGHASGALLRGHTSQPPLSDVEVETTMPKLRWGASDVPPAGTPIALLEVDVGQARFFPVGQDRWHDAQCMRCA